MSELTACLPWASVGQRGPLVGHCGPATASDKTRYINCVVGMSEKIVATGPCDAPGCGRSDDGVRYRWAQKPELAGKQVCPKSVCQDWGGHRDLEKLGEGGETGKIGGCESRYKAAAKAAAAKAADAAAKEASAAAFAACCKCSSALHVVQWRWRAV